MFIIKKLSNKMAACCFLTGIVASNNVAFSDDSFRYCGKLLWPSQREEYLPFPVGIEASFSTEPKVAQAIQELGKYTVHFSLDDMSISYRLMQSAVDIIIAQGINHVCLQAGTVEISRTGIPLEVSPIPSADGKVVLKFVK